MILSGIIILWLLLVAVGGYHRGVVAVILSLIGNILAIAVALGGASGLASWFSNLNQTTGTQAPSITAVIIAFFAILIVARLLVRLVISWTRVLTHLPVVRQINGLAGMVLAVGMHYLIVSLVLGVLLIAPGATLLDQYAESPVAQFVTKNSPFHDTLDTWFQTPSQDGTVPATTNV